MAEDSCSNGVRPALQAVEVAGGADGGEEAMECRNSSKWSRAPWSRAPSLPATSSNIKRRNSVYISERLAANRRSAKARLIAVHGTALAICALLVVVGATFGMLALTGTLATPHYRHVAWLVVRFGAVLVVITWPYPTRHMVAGAVLCAAATWAPYVVLRARGLSLPIACGEDCPCALGDMVCLTALVDLLRALGGASLWLLTALRLELALRVRPKLSTHTMLARFWRVSGQALIAQGTLDIVLRSSTLSLAELGLLSALQETALGFALISQAVRSAVQGWLVAHGTVVTSAASIALLLGETGATEDVEQLARERFTCVSAEEVLVTDFLSNSARPSIAIGRQEAARLGEVDAFVSHSWHDDAQAKFDALQEWRRDFKARHADREPTLWIDILAIDQCNIKESLACLPLYLAGCQTLLLLAGPSYLTRLWCVIELFVFVQMGGSEAQIIVLPLAPPSTDGAVHRSPSKRLESVSDPCSATMANSERIAPGISRTFTASVSSASVMTIDAQERAFELAIEAFDVRNATCFVKEDRQRLSAVIAAGFVNLDNFNRVISGTLMRSLAQAGETRRRSPVKRGLSKNGANFLFSGSPTKMPSRQFAPPVGTSHSELMERLQNGSLKELADGDPFIDGVHSYTKTLEKGLFTNCRGVSSAIDLPSVPEGPPPIETRSVPASLSSPSVLIRNSLVGRGAVIVPLGRGRGAEIVPDSGLLDPSSRR
mmetsp:Transcript_7165/g.17501  ORF Transcript_7165/g.17501 Transcript_7165/m.17501 type:complete len:718 (-) Transcript_7165:80-2233(-)